MSVGELLEIEPPELKFPFELRKQVSCALQLSNKSDDHIAFKVKTTNPKKYCVRPNNGVILPRSTCDVVVTMQAQREVPDDMQCKDKFLVQSAVINPGTTAKNITAEMFSRELGNKVDEVKLRVVYASPPQPPSPVHEESDEGSSPRASVSENIEISEPVVQARALVAHQEEKYTETMTPISRLTEEKNTAVQQNNKLQEEITMTPISRLTEEKNTAVQQNNKLQEEIELLKREVSKQHGGSFSFMFVMIIALLGVLVGYLVKT